RIIGDYVLCAEDYIARRSFDDEICRNSYFIDLHLTKDEARTKGELEMAERFNRYGKGESHGIPYRCLTPRDLKNVLVAGRSISCDRSVQGSVRVMPVCLAMGEAAGMAAAHALRVPGVNVHEVDTNELRRRLRDEGAYLPTQNQPASGNGASSTPELCGDLKAGKAFTLVELLVVVAIMGMLATLITPAFNHFGKASLLDTEGNRVANLIYLAGQNSVSKNAMTALIAASPDASGAYRALTLFEYVPEASDWKQFWKWETLKDGIVFDPTCFATFTDSSTQPQPVFPAIRYGGTLVGAYKYLIVLPNRSLLQDTSAQIKLAEGFFSSGVGVPIYTRRAQDGTPANYYNVTVLSATGRPKIDRP
ncbi:MAG: FAD-dependent oxidoreductase, partial [Opitutaceae bacterium]|nr:FAD-dependent oxidoreductase [Verrucomicrobiales bacterium]